MSTFFKALERAEQEHLDRSATPAGPPAESTPPAPEATRPQVVHPPQATLAPSPASRTRAALERPTDAARKVVVARPSVFTAPPPAPRDNAREHEEPIVGLEEHLVSLLAPSSFEAEQYRALRHTIEQLHRESELSVIAVSSADSGDGKTTTTINLAGALAQAHETRVLVVDGDLRGANLAAHFGVEGTGRPGLVDAILNPNLTLASVIQEYRHLNLSVITAGRGAAAPYEVLKSPRVGELFAEARANFDYVIVDTPPLVSVPDGRLLAKWIDGFLIVVAAHRTPRKLVDVALNLMEGSKVVGLVFNGDDRHVSKSVYSSRARRIVRGDVSRRQTASD
jgi:capsular exopolysaccharide synthesis family protein